MGTNYYLEMRINEKEVEVLEKFGLEAPQLHIGKSSGGWEFMFYFPTAQELERFGIDSRVFDYNSWKKIINDNRFEVVDEYGEVISPRDFEKLVESSKGLLNHKDEMLKAKHQFDKDHAKHHCFNDKEGFTFTDVEFS